MELCFVFSKSPVNVLYFHNLKNKGREVGGGIRMGNMCKSMADSCQCMTKPPLQCCEVISLQLIKINEKKDLYSFHIAAGHKFYPSSIDYKPGDTVTYPGT